MVIVVVQKNKFDVGEPLYRGFLDQDGSNKLVNLFTERPKWTI